MGCAWVLRLSHRSAKALRRMGGKDRRLVASALGQIEQNPFRGDVRRLVGRPSTLRHRVGNWRIFVQVDTDKLVIDVTAIERRTSTTYKRR